MRLFDSHFKKISWSNLLAQFSEQVALAAAPLAAVLLLNAGPSETAWLQTSQTLPFLLLSIPIGLIVDRLSRRNLMIGAEMLRALSLVMVLLLLLSSSLSLIWLAALGFLGAVGTVVYSVATPAYIPTIIAKSQLVVANRWLELARSIAFAAGPALGGALVGYIGVSTAYTYATILSMLAFMLLMSLPQEANITCGKKHIFADLKQGARFIFKHDYLRPILFTAIFFNMGWFIIQGVFVAYAALYLSLSAAQIGFIISLYGIGMVVGAFGLKYISSVLPYGLMILLGPIGGLLAAIMMLWTIWMPTIYLAGLSYFLFGVGPVIWSITTMSLRQVVTPGKMMGRVSAFILTVTFGARPAGTTIAALLTMHYGVKSCLWAACIGFLIQFIILALSEVPSLKKRPENAE